MATSMARRIAVGGGGGGRAAAADTTFSVLPGVGGCAAAPTSVRFDVAGRKALGARRCRRAIPL